MEIGGLCFMLIWESSLTITFSAEWPPSIARQSMLTQMKDPLREIPHFSWLRSSGIPGIELWKQLIIWSGYPFMPYISQQSTNCSLIRHEETFSLFPNLFLVWGCNLIYSSLVSPSRKGERRLMLRFLSLNYHTAEWTCFCVNKRYK